MVETTFRILSKVDVGEDGETDVEDKLGDVFMVQFALLKYLQDEYAVLMVNGATNPETARIFRSFRRNASAFAPDVIDDLRNAASVVAAGQVQTPRPQFRDNRPGRGRGFSGRGGFQNSYNRGAYNNYFGRNYQGGFNNRGRDPYAQFSRQVPFNREREDYTNNTNN